ncbi:hypothetical protein D3C86_2021280 [compost metagenome]
MKIPDLPFRVEEVKVYCGVPDGPQKLYRSVPQPLLQQLTPAGILLHSNLVLKPNRILLLKNRHIPTPPTYACERKNTA